MSQNAMAPRQTASETRRERRRVVLLSAAAGMALLGPMLLVGLVILWALFRVEGPSSDKALQTSVCQRALRCCQLVEGSPGDTCHSVAALAGESSGVAQSDRWAENTTAARCENELRRLHSITESRGQSIPICSPMDVP